jgi:hypothetical protein
MKTCSKCGVRQPNSEFPYREGTRRGGYCRGCSAGPRRPAGWYEALPPEKKEERRNATRHYYNQNREMVLARLAARRAARRRAAMGIKPTVSVWRDEVIDTLRKLQAEGLSALQIALQLNQAFEISVTRCAVIGKLHRMGLRSGKKPDAAETEPRQALAS